MFYISESLRIIRKKQCVSTRIDETSWMKHKAKTWSNDNNSHNKNETRWDHVLRNGQYFLLSMLLLCRMVTYISHYVNLSFDHKSWQNLSTQTAIGYKNTKHRSYTLPFYIFCYWNVFYHFRQCIVYSIYDYCSEKTFIVYWLFYLMYNSFRTLWFIAIRKQYYWSFSSL